MPNHRCFSPPVALAVAISPTLLAFGRLDAAPDFSTPTHYGTAPGPLVVAISDLNGDASPDLAVISRSGDLTLRFNDGAGGFPNFSVHSGLWGAEAIDIAAGDLDADGDADLAVALLEIDGTIAILRNHGDGTFDPPSFHHASSFAKGVTIARLNADALADVAMMSNAFKATVFLNDGSNGFTLGGHYGAGYVSTVIRTADLDGDSDLDIVFVNSGIRNVTVLKNAGDGTFLPHVWYDTGDYPNDVVLADLDEDGDVDLATPNVYEGNISLLRNQGDGTFLTSEDLPGVAGPTGIAAGDFELDGRLDLVVASGSGDDVAVLSNTGSGFGAPARRNVGSQPTDVAVADLNGDQRPDLVTVNWEGEDVTVLLNTTVVGVREGVPGGGSIGLAAPFPNPTRGAVSTAIVLASDARVRLDVHDVHGRVRHTLIDRPLTAGTHPVRWEGIDSRRQPLPPGLYFLRLSVDGMAARSRCFVLIR